MIGSTYVKPTNGIEIEPIKLTTEFNPTDNSPITDIIRNLKVHVHKIRCLVILYIDLSVKLFKSRIIG